MKWLFQILLFILAPIGLFSAALNLNYYQPPVTLIEPMFRLTTGWASADGVFSMSLQSNSVNGFSMEVNHFQLTNRGLAPGDPNELKIDVRGSQDGQPVLAQGSNKSLAFGGAARGRQRTMVVETQSGTLSSDTFNVITTSVVAW